MDNRNTDRPSNPSKFTGCDVKQVTQPSNMWGSAVLPWLKLALCLTLLVRTAADCVAKPFHAKEPLNGHKTDNFNETWFIPWLKYSHVAVSLWGTPCLLETLKTLLKEATEWLLERTSIQWNSRSGRDSMSNIATKAHARASTTGKYTISKFSTIVFMVYWKAY